MKSLKGVIVAAAGLTAIVASLLSPSLPPSGAYTFAATNAGCEVREEGRQSIASFARGKIAGGPERGDSFDRVVRIYKDVGKYAYIGTGHVIGGNYVLTAGHVAIHGIDGGEQYVISGDRKWHSSKVLQVDSKADIGLVKILSDDEKGPGGIRIGNIRDDDKAIMKTIDTTDGSYEGGSKSHTEVKLARYEYKKELLPGAKQEIKKLEKGLEVLKTDAFQRKEQAYELLKPYYDPEGRWAPKREKANALSNVVARPDIAVREKPKDYNSYVGQTEQDAFIRGMSGSAIFNESGNLVGIAINTLIRAESSGSVSISGRAEGYEKIPESVRRQADALFEQELALNDTVRGIEEKIRQLKNPADPVTTTYSAVSPKAIVSFLEKACSSTA